MLIELDGSFHTETPVKADERKAILSLQGAIVQRIDALQM
jgi:very-short-patch-repair endonuclease